MKYLYLLIVFTGIFASCAPGKSGSQTSIENLARNRIGENFLCVYNADSTFLLCKSGEALNQPFRYFVYNISSESIVHDASFPRGRVDWVSDFSIREERIPGIVQSDGEQSIKIINVKAFSEEKP